MKYVTFVTCDDWVAMYVNGRKVMENHSITGQQAAEALLDNVTSMEVDQEWVEINALPEHLGDIPQEVRI